jgi:hypothetical protein
LAPQRAVEGGVAAALFGQIGGGRVGVVGDGFLCAVGEFDGFDAGVGDAHQVQCVLKGHGAETDRTVFQVGVARLADVVEVDVDDVVEHAHGDADGVFQLGVIERAIAECDWPG